MSKRLTKEEYKVKLSRLNEIIAYITDVDNVDIDEIKSMIDEFMDILYASIPLYGDEKIADIVKHCMRFCTYIDSEGNDVVNPMNIADMEMYRDFFKLYNDDDFKVDIHDIPNERVDVYIENVVNFLRGHHFLFKFEPALEDSEIDKRFVGYFDVKSFDKANIIIDEILSIEKGKNSKSKSARKRIKGLKDAYCRLEVYSIN